jgi:putative flippase GtrA
MTWRYFASFAVNKKTVLSYICPVRRHIHTARDLILPVIDFFYPPFKRLMGLKTFRYAASGGINTFLGFTVYYITFRFLLHRDILDLGFYAFKPHVAALFVSFLFSFPFGFFLMKYVVFSDSNMKGKVQLFRYFLLYLFNLVLNYFLLKLFVEMLGIYAVFAQIMTIAIIILFSYVAQRYFTFRIRSTEEEITG